MVQFVMPLPVTHTHSIKALVWIPAIPLVILLVCLGKQLRMGPCHQVRNPDGVPGSCLQLGSTPRSWGVNQKISLFLSLLFCVSFCLSKNKCFKMLTAILETMHSLSPFLFNIALVVLLTKKGKRKKLNTFCLERKKKEGDEKNCQCF